MLDFLFKNFKRQKAQEVITLISINSLVPMPKREDFKDDFLEIDNFKKEYLNSLKKDKTIVSHDLIPEELQNFKNIYLDLLVSLCLEDETDVNFDKVNYCFDKSFDFWLEIKRIKLMLYHDAVTSLYKEASLRLIALSELLEENILNKNKKQAIINEINNMSFALFTFNSQLKAMEKEMLNYFSEIVHSKNENTKEKSEIIDYRFKEVREMALLLIPKELKYLETLNLDPIILIAKLEQLLEIFVYTHPEVLEDLKTQVLDLYNSIKEKNNKNEPISFKDLTQEVKTIELKYKTFSLFTRNKVHKKDLELLYEIKFWLFTYDLSLINSSSILNNATFTEVECYQDIIYRKIEKILKGENLDVLDLADDNGKKREDVIKWVSDVLKNGKETYSAWDILNNERLLAFLMAFDTRSGIIDFFDLPYTKNDFPNLNYYDEIFKWDNVMPLATFYKIMKCNRITKVDVSEDINDYDPLYEIYLLIEVYKESRIEYKMPLGLKEIIIPINIMDTKYKPVIEYIRALTNRRTVIMPSTLQRLVGNLFDKTPINSIVLNKNLQEIKNDALLMPSLAELTILGNPKDYSLNSIPFFQFRMLTINKNADMLNDPNVFISLYNVELSNLDDNSQYPLIYDQSKDFFQSVYNDYDMRVYLFRPCLMSLIILNDDGKEINIFTKRDLTFKVKVKHDFPSQSIWKIINDFIISCINDNLEQSNDNCKR